MGTIDSDAVARRVLTLPLIGIAAVTKLTLARLLAAFDPPDTVETRVDLDPFDDGEADGR